MVVETERRSAAGHVERQKSLGIKERLGTERAEVETSKSTGKWDMSCLNRRMIVAGDESMREESEVSAAVTVNVAIGP